MSASMNMRGILYHCGAYHDPSPNTESSNAHKHSALAPNCVVESSRTPNLPTVVPPSYFLKGWTHSWTRDVFLCHFYPLRCPHHLLNIHKILLRPPTAIQCVDNQKPKKYNGLTLSPSLSLFFSLSLSLSLCSRST